ncbi:hypothetical protein Tco_1149472 [Tanacetum coccineum]
MFPLDDDGILSIALHQTVHNVISSAVVHGCAVLAFPRRFEVEAEPLDIVNRNEKYKDRSGLNPWENYFGFEFFLWKKERVRLLVDSHGASKTPSYSPGSSTTPSYSPGPSTPPSYYPGPSRNAECANCKLLIRKLQVLEATLEMYMHPKKHTIDSTALLHELYNDMRKFSLE